MPQESPLTSYLRVIADAQHHLGPLTNTVHSHVLQHGRLFTSQPLTPQEQDHINR